MPYIIKKTSGEVLVDIPDGAIDSATTSLSLVGKNLAGYGFYQNTNFLHLLENFANTTQPDSPIVGQLWFDTEQKKLKTYTKFQTSAVGVEPVTFGYEWKTVANITASSSQPLSVSSVAGDLWYDTATNRLNIFNGLLFDLVGTNVPGYGRSRLEGSTIQSSSATHPVLNLYLDDVLVAIISKDDFQPATPITNLHANSTNPGHIKNGINFLANSILNGIADQASNIVDADDGPLTTASFVRNDTNLEQRIQSSVKVLGSLAVGVRNADNNNYVIKTGNYQGSNASTSIDAQITFSGNKLVFTKDTPDDPASDVLIIDTESNQKSFTPLISNLDLGRINNRFDNVYANIFSGSVVGNVVGDLSGNTNSERVRVDKIYTRDGSTVVVDLTKPTAEHYGAFVGTFVGLTTGTLEGDVNGNLTGTVTGSLEGDVNGNLTGNVTGTLQGSVFGNLKGNVLASDNSTAYNSISKQFFGSLVGNAITATSLQFSKTINGIPFDGSDNIVIEDNTKVPKVGNSTITGTLTIAGGNIINNVDPTLDVHLVNKRYVDNLVQSRPLFFSLDTKGLSETGSGPGSVVEILNALAPVANLAPLTLCRVASTIQNVSSSTSATTYASFISITYITNLSVVTTVNNPTRNNDLVYRVNAGKTSWEYVSG
jgi:hypothetical protein